MTVDTPSAAAALAAFAVDGAQLPDHARRRAALAVLDTVGVTIAGAAEPAAQVVQNVAREEGGNTCGILGTGARASATGAALANGTAAHALDYDDMCFVSLAHPSAPLVPAILAAAEVSGASGRAVLDAYVVGFEIEARLGRAMNPRHYQRGWHCTSTLGTIGAAAAASRILRLDTVATGHALGIAASSASGLKENFGTMTKPLHAGLAARNGLLAAVLAMRGLMSSRTAFEGAQGFLAAMDSERTDLGEDLADLGTRWEIIETGIAVKLYPSCAGTHPALDALLDLRRAEGFSAEDVERVDIDVDLVAPTVLIYDRPATGLEAKFSMPFCAAAALVDGRVGIDTFAASHLQDPAIRSLMPRIVMRGDPTLEGRGAPLTQAQVTVRLRDGRVVSRAAHGARGYPDHPATDLELDEKFLTCTGRVLPHEAAQQALRQLRQIEQVDDVRSIVGLLSVHEPEP